MKIINESAEKNNELFLDYLHATLTGAEPPTIDKSKPIYFDYLAALDGCDTEQAAAVIAAWHRAKFIKINHFHLLDSDVRVRTIARAALFGHHGDAPDPGPPGDEIPDLAAPDDGLDQPVDNDDFDREQWLNAQFIRALSVPATAEPIQFNERYVSDADIELEKSTVIRSFKNSGKSYAIVLWCKRFFDEHGRWPRVLITVHRVFLALTLTEDLNNAAEALGLALRFQSYKEFSGPARDMIRDCPRLVICQNSLARLQNPTTGTISAFDILFVEEAEAQAAHFAVGKWGKPQRASAAMHILRRVAANAPHTAALDADAGQRTENLMRHLVPDAYPQWYVNAYQPQLVPMRRVTKPELIFDQARQVLAGDEASSVVIATDSREKARELHTAFQKLGYNPIGIWRDCEESKTTLLNIDTELPRRRILIYSPTVDAGVNITVPAHLFGLFFGNSNDVHSQRQQLGRVRNPVGEISVFYGNYRTAEWERGDYRASWHYYKTKCANATAGLVFIDDTGDYSHPATRAIEWVIAEHRAIVALQNRDKAAFFFAAEQLAGRQIIDDESMTVNYENSADVLSRAGIENEETRIEGILESEPVTLHEKRALERAERFTETDEFGFTRWALETLTGETISRDIIDDFEPRVSEIPNLVDLMSDAATLAKSDRRDFMGDKALPPAALSHLRKRAPRQALIEWFFEMLFDDWNIANVEAWEWTSAPHENFDAIMEQADYIRAVMGIRMQGNPDIDAPHKLIRQVLRRLGFDVKRVGRRMINGERVSVYRAVDAEQTLKMAARWADAIDREIRDCPHFSNQALESNAEMGTVEPISEMGIV